MLRSKTVDGVKHTYTLNGSQIVSEQWDDKLLVFIYDESGSPIGMQYRTKSMAEGTFYTYLFEKNLQGDIIAVYNTSGTKLISYVYDAWGNVTVTNHNVSGTNSGARHNPFRYRGYYYDTETGYYYLQSRYYNPKWGRFLNADSYLSTGTGLIAYNMYAYCNNNPTMGYDPTGEWTYSIGFSVSAFLFGGSTFSINLSIDSQGNVALQKSKADMFSDGGGVTLGLAAIGISQTNSFTKLDSVNDLEGEALNIGGSIPVYKFISAGGEAILANDEFVGSTVNVGVGTGVDVHAAASTTDTIFQFNLVEVSQKVWSTIKGWFGG